jgi:mRNA-degrading endonuclease toxin of MazEF toxin-antitoxin module
VNANGLYPGRWFDETPGDYLSNHGKLRSALIVQSDLLADLDSVVLCPVTSDLRDPVFRVTVEPNPANGLRTLSQIMVNKLSTLRATRARSVRRLGSLIPKGFGRWIGRCCWLWT